MSKQIKIHENQYEVFKTTKVKKPEWIQNQDTSLFSTFNVRSQVFACDQRLARAGLSTDILNEKYNKIFDRFLVVHDLNRICLWVNNLYRENFPGNPLLKELTVVDFEDYVDNDVDHSLKEFEKDVATIFQTLPKSFVVGNLMSMFKGDLMLELRYDRIDDFEGKPFGFLAIGRQVQKSNPRNQIPSGVVVKKKELTPSEVVRIKFQEVGLSLEDVTLPFVDSDTPTFIINQIGRIFWMNRIFQRTFQKSSADLLEYFDPCYGFEAYEQARDFVLMSMSSFHEFKGIIFEQIVNKVGYVLGYIVMFKSSSYINITPNKSKKELCTEVLLHAEVSPKITLETLEQMDRNPIATCIVGIEGILLYMNPVFREVTLRDDDDLLKPYIYEIGLENPHLRDVFDQVFRFDHPTEYVFVSDIFAKKKNTLVSCKLHLVRIDSIGGTPRGYYCYLTPVKPNQ